MDIIRPSDWLFCDNVLQWRKWLSEHHESETKVWLEIKKAKASTMGIRLHEAVEQALCFGWIDGRMYSIDSEKFIIHVSERRENSVWSLVNKRRALALIEDSQMTEAGLLKVKHAKENGMWDQAYTSKDAAHIEAIFMSHLSLNSGAHTYYLSLSHIERLHVIMWIEQCKTIENLTKRIDVVINKLETNDMFGLLLLIF